MVSFPVIDDPGETPTSPLIVVAPVLVTVLDPSTPKFFADPRLVCAISAEGALNSTPSARTARPIVVRTPISGFTVCNCVRGCDSDIGHASRKEKPSLQRAVSGFPFAVTEFYDTVQLSCVVTEMGDNAMS